MSALPIEPTPEQLTVVVLDASRRGDRPTVALFQAGVEAERARAAAETTEEWGVNYTPEEGDRAFPLPDETIAREIVADFPYSVVVRRNVRRGPWEVQS